MSKSEFDLLSKKIVKVYGVPVDFDYIEIKKNDYETDLMDSFIHSKSPDIFLINNEQLGEFKKLISPLDLNQKNYNINNLDKDFPTIIKEQAVFNNELYMLPITIDSLALYYNRNTFDSLSIPNPPKT
ncbi:MAG: extracellular solute-binding protein [Candidatus Pacebacteria bacterium]|nr:extracellular solute-binding protein [Candidatus Paceibacterota bacterium]